MSNSSLLFRSGRFPQVLLIVLAVTFAAILSPQRLWAAQDGLASLEELKSQAFTALRDGRFDRTQELLTRALSISDDQSIKQMVHWIGEFEAQRQLFLEERRKQHEKALADASLLLDNGMKDFAVAHVARAYLLAEDKDAFRAEPWVDEMVVEAIRRAEQYEADEQWVKALRLYSELGSIEPANPQWKEKLKLMTRRVRLLALYTPDELRRIREADTEAAEKAERLLNPDAEQQAKLNDTEDEHDGFRIDWQENLHGIHAEMLREALVHAGSNYYREERYQKLLLGGLHGLKTLATTSGLEQTFEHLADPDRREAFLARIDNEIDKVTRVPANAELPLIAAVVDNLRLINSSTIKLPEEVWVSEFADGAFAELDPFTGMIWPNDLEEFAKTTQGEFSGVGIQIQSDPDGSLRVVSPLEDTPAFRAGIRAGDVITHIDGRNARGITLNQAVRNITGPSGTSVSLTVRSPDGQVREFDIIRETIKVASIKGWRQRSINDGGGWDYLVDPDQKIGYIRMTQFTKTTADDLDRAVSEMIDNGAEAMILDLRYNPGGLLEAAKEVADRFLRGGTIVSTRADRPFAHNHATELRASITYGEIELPTVVLVNQYSASASEIVSGALQDNKRALVVGERTFGKGSVQMLFPIARQNGVSGPPTAYLKLTTSHYYLPSERNIHRKENSTIWGVDPDVLIEMTPEQMDAAIKARQDLDVLRDDIMPAEPEQQALDAEAEGAEQGVEVATKKDPLASDPQLSAALLLLRLQLAGAQL